MNESPAAAAPDRLGMRVLAAFILGLETVALAVVGSAYLVFGVVGNTSDRAFPLAVSALTLVVSVALAVATWGVWHRRRWATSLAITWQVLQGLVALSLFSVRPTIAVIAVILAAVAGLAVLRSMPPRV